MAESNQPVSLTTIVECSICFEIMDDPKALSCLHHFCDSCTRQFQRVREEGTDATGISCGIYCPICRQFTPETAIQSSFLMRNFLDVYDKIKNVPKREVSMKYCIKHPDNLLKYNCVACNMVVCADCKIAFHDEHKTETIGEALRKKLPLLRTNLQTMRIQNEKIQQGMTKIEESKDKYNLMCDATRKKIEAHTKYAIVKLEIDSHKLIDTLETKREEEMNELEIIKADLAETISTQENFIANVDSIINQPDSQESLSAIQEGFILEMDKHIQDTSAKSIRFQIHKRTFVPQIIKLAENAVGSLSIEIEAFNSVLKVQQCNESTFKMEDDAIDQSQENDAEYYLEPIAQYESNANHSVGDIQAVERIPEYPAPPLPPKRRPDPSFRITKVDLECLSTKISATSSNFTLNKQVGRICYFNSKFWCPCVADNCIDIYSEEGKLLETLRIGDLKEPLSIHPLTDFQMLVATKKGLYIVNIHDRCIELELSSGHFRDVHVNGNITVALEKTGHDKDKVVVFDSKFLPPVMDKYFMIENCALQRVIVIQDHIFVSFHEPGKDSYIAHYNTQGDLLKQYGKPGRKRIDEVNCPMLCGSDSQGTILIADSNNKKLKVINYAGQWSELKIKIEKLPMDAVFVGTNTMWVLFYDNTRRQYGMKKYKF